MPQIIELDPDKDATMILELSRTLLVIIDAQEKLFAAMHEKDKLEKGLSKITRGAQILGIPIVYAEQNPEKMGQTISPLHAMLAPQQPISKMSFSCCGVKDFLDALQNTGRDQILLAGIETHVCVCQTALHLLEHNYDIQIIVDATSSRNPRDREIALARIQHEAARRNKMSALSTAEATLFELMLTAEHPKFREILKIVR
jgi:nicotinamidase-related amidase